MKYYVIYQEFVEFNQLEGAWENCYDSFDSHEDAIKAVERMNKSHDFRKIIGPLAQVT